MLQKKKGAAFTACGMLTLAGTAGDWIALIRPDQLYILGAMLIVVGTVIQDVVADAMSTEIVWLLARRALYPSDLLGRA